MLQRLRDNITGWFAWTIFGVIALAFALWGVGNYSFTAQTAVAAVNGDEIATEEVRRVYRNQLTQYQQMYDEIPAVLQTQIRDQVLQGLVRDELLAQHTRDEGYRIGDESLITAIRNMPVFQDQGQFSMDLFRTRLSLQGMPVQYFEEQMRRSLRITQLQQAIANTAIVTPAELERRARLEGQKRRAEYARISPEIVQEQVNVTDEELQAHYDENPDRYMRPDEADISYIEIDADQLAEGVDISEEELRQFYNDEVESGRFVAPNERKARHILISVGGEVDDAMAIEQAEDIRLRLDAGEDFATLAVEYSDDPGSAPEGGDLGWAGRDAYVGAFADALFSMDEGEIVGPVRTEFGYHIIQLDAVRGGGAQPFDELRDELRVELSSRQAEDEFFDLAERAADLSFENPDSLEPIAKDLGLEMQQLQGITRGGAAGLAGEPAVIDAVFSERVLEQRENSDPIKIGETKRVVLRATEYRPAAVRPFVEVVDQIRAELEARRARQLTAERGEQLLERVRGGEALAEVATEVAAEYNEPAEYTRSGNLAPELRIALFNAAKPQPPSTVVEGVSLADGSYTVFVLSEVIPGDPQAERNTEPLLSQAGLGDLAAYISALRSDANIILRPELLDN